MIFGLGDIIRGVKPGRLPKGGENSQSTALNKQIIVDIRQIWLMTLLMIGRIKYISQVVRPYIFNGEMMVTML